MRYSLLSDFSYRLNYRVWLPTHFPLLLLVIVNTRVHQHYTLHEKIKINPLTSAKRNLAHWLSPLLLIFRTFPVSRMFFWMINQERKKEKRGISFLFICMYNVPRYRRSIHTTFSDSSTERYFHFAFDIEFKLTRSLRKQ